MALSNELISQFVKATKDKQNTNKENIVYGTVRKDTDKNICVQLDGSEMLTPVKSTVVLAEGDRVTVMIKNHTATVTGNLTNPSASESDTKLIVKDLEAEQGRIDNLTTANLTVQQTLEAHQAVIDELDTTYATIENLDAAKGNITTLTSELAEINTLIFGSATGNVIQTTFSNAVIAQLGDAQIKSAMIESISAGKITAGDIITNNVRVKSEDGSLIISDETLQISDENRVRVQIGKDASNDYSINIWDQNGKLMFSKGGITDAAIKEAIIRNDMVSDTANIHASKLDIDSLFEEINDDGSNTIKSTKVYLDEEGQTLDVAFKSLTTEVTEQGETISSQGIQISAIQGQISSKVWQQDIDTATDEMSTQYSTLEQDVDNFKTTVSETYATVSDTTNLNTRMSTVEQTADTLSIKLSNLEIGGENLLIGSKEITNVLHITSSVSDFNNCFKAAKCDANWQGVGVLANDLIMKGSVGDEFTFSVNMFSNTPVSIHFYAMCYDSNNQRVYPTLSPGQINNKQLGISSDYEEDKRYSITFSITQGWIDLINEGGTVKWTIQVTDVSSESPAYLYAPKLERGNKATDWSPNHVDLYDSIDKASKTATNYLNFSSSGLVIGDLTASSLGKNVLIDSDSVDIRNGTTTLASFGADYLYLAKNSRNATIDLCNGLAKLYHQSRLSYDTLFVIETPNATEIRGTSDPLCVTSTVASKPAIKFANKDGVLGSIGMVASGTESYITRNHPSTAATYSILDTGNYYKLMDSGWLTCAINTSGSFTVYDDGSNIRYRKIGKMVEVVGAVKPKTTLDAGTTSYVFATLPTGFRPSLAITERSQGSDGYSWLFSITTGGELRYSRYSNGSSCVDLPAQTWLPFHTTFFTD